MLPGDSLDIDGIVENNGTSKVYVLLNFAINVTKLDGTSESVCSKTYTIANSKLSEVTGTVGSYSAVAMTLEAANANKTNTYKLNFKLSHLFDVYKYNNEYKNATVTYTLSAHAIQFDYIADASEATTLLLEKISNEQQA